MSVVFSRHALEELERRRIPRIVVEAVVREPEQVVPARGGRHACQSRVVVADGRSFLVRAIVVRQGDDEIVVTVYRTSRIGRYWREP